MNIIDGKKIRNTLLEKYEADIKKNNYKMKLAIIQIGLDQASEIYIRNKIKVCSSLNIDRDVYKYQDISKGDLKRLINKLNKDTAITGIMIELPLPKQFDEEEVLNWISPYKDVDGLCRQNKVVPCTAEAVIEILKYHKISLKQRIVLIGYSKLIGKPLEKYFLDHNIVPIICNTKTNNLKEKTKNADIIITATGVKNILTSDMVKDNVVIIDCGIIKEQNRVRGDTDFEALKEKCKLITPVPNGVGPVTTAMVVKNLISLYQEQIDK